MVYKNIFKFLCCCLFCLCLFTQTQAAEKPPKYTVFEGQTYRWNSQMKKYFPYQTPQQRLQQKYLQQRLNGMSSRATMSQPTRIKWWDFYGF